MRSDNLKPVDPNDPRLGVLILSPEQKAILENCDRIIALENRMDVLEHSSDRHRRDAERNEVIEGSWS